MRRVMVVFNPNAGRGANKAQRLQRLGELLERNGMVMEATPTQRAGDATEIVRRCRDRFDAVAAWGGDGTINEVSAGLLGGETPLVVLPGGTVNVFARECGIPRSMERAAAALPTYEVREIHCGLADGRPFVLMAGIGLDARVVQRLEQDLPDLKARLGARAFWQTGLALWRESPQSLVTVDCAGSRISGALVIAGNLRRYAHCFFVTPNARLEEASLELMVFTGQTRSALLRLLVGIVSGFHLHYRDVVLLSLPLGSTARIFTDSEAQPVPCHLDGEPAGSTPMTLSVSPKRLRVLLPEGHGLPLS